MSDEQKKTMFGYAAPQMPSPAAPQQGAPAPQAGGPMGHMPPAVGHTTSPGHPEYGQAQVQDQSPHPGQAQEQDPQGYGQPQGQGPGQQYQQAGQQFQQDPHGQQGHPGQQQQGHPGQQQQGHPGQQQQGHPGQQFQQGPHGQQGQQQQGHPGQQQQGYAPQSGQGQPYQQAPQGYGPGPGQSYPPQGHAPQARTASKGLYLALHFGGLGVGLILLLWGINDRAVQELIPFAPIPILVGLISFYVLLFKAWASIQDGYAKTTPGKAVGFSFIPFFNLYWMFVAIGSWGSEYNAFTQRRGQHNAYQASPGLFTTHCILQILIGGIAFLITMPMVISQMCNGINSIASGNLPRAEIRS